MPRKSMRSSMRSRKGGMWPFDSVGQGSSSTSSWGDWFYGKKDEQGTGYQPSGTGYMSSGTGYPPQTNSSMGYGGRKGKRRRSMRGGNFLPNTPTTGLAYTAASVSGVPTASALYVGGRTRRRRHSKSCKKSCRKH